MLIRIIYILLFVYSIYAYRRVSRAFKALCLLIWITVVCEYLAYFYYPQPSISAVFGHLYTLGIIVPFYLLFREFLHDQNAWKIMRWIFAIVFLICFFNSVYIESFQLMPTINMNVISLSVILCTLFCYLKMLKQPTSISLVMQSMFWLCTSFLMYHTASFFVFTLSNYFYKNNFSSYLLQEINVVMCCLYYPALGFSLWLNSQESTNERST